MVHNPFTDITSSRCNPVLGDYHNDTYPLPAERHRIYPCFCDSIVRGDYQYLLHITGIERSIIMTNNFLGRLIKQTLTYAVIGYVMGMILITLMTSYASASQVSRLNGALGIIGLSVDILPIIFAIVLYIGATIQVVGEWREYKQLQLEIKKSSNELAEIENQLLKG